MAGIEARLGRLCSRLRLAPKAYYRQFSPHRWQEVRLRLDLAGTDFAALDTGPKYGVHVITVRKSVPGVFGAPPPEITGASAAAALQRVARECGAVGLEISERFAASLTEEEEP